MWRDIERRCVRYGLPARLPAPYPLLELEFANRVAVVGEQEGGIQAYVQHTYQHWFGGVTDYQRNTSDQYLSVKTSLAAFD